MSRFIVMHNDIERGAQALERELMNRGGGDEFLYEMTEDVREEFLHSVAEVVLRAGTQRPELPDA